MDEKKVAAHSNQPSGTPLPLCCHSAIKPSSCKPSCSPFFLSFFLCLSQNFLVPAPILCLWPVWSVPAPENHLAALNMTVLAASSLPAPRLAASSSSLWRWWLYAHFWFTNQIYIYVVIWCCSDYNVTVMSVKTHKEIMKPFRSECVTIFKQCNDWLTGWLSDCWVDWVWIECGLIWELDIFSPDFFSVHLLINFKITLML